MAMIHVNRGATSLGAFPEEEVREGLRTGRFALSDLGWREGMPSWKPLSQFEELGAAAPAAPPPQAGATATEPAAPRSGLPWEHRQQRGFFNGFIETLAMVLTKPDLAFRTMKTEGGLAEPLIYALVGGCVGGIVSFLFSLGLQSMGLFAGQRDTFAALAGLGIGSIALVVLVPVFIVIVLFIGAAIVHLCLMLVGGANKSFEATFRVLAFSQGSTGLLQIIPVCGGLIAAVWALVVNCIGLARSHEISTGRAVLAVLLPLVVCCGAGILLLIMFGGIAALSQHH